MSGNKRDRMMARGQQHGALDLNALLQEAAGWESGQTPTRDTTPPNQLPLPMIGPDPAQPRRAMPDLLRQEWCNGAPISEVFRKWQALVFQDLPPLDVAWDVWILGTEEPPTINMPHPHIMRWIDLLALAGNIYQRGLSNPILVYEVNGGYRLLDGERRLLAFNLLAWAGYEGFDTIPARIGQYSTFFQAIENGVRKDLTAIGVARQLALLLMALNEMAISPPAQVNQSWYAQAADLRVPYGQGDQVALMLGLPNNRMLNRYRDLLKLPGVVWNWADEFGWTEGFIRGLTGKANRDPEKLIQLAQAEVNKILGKTTKPQRTPEERVVTYVEQVTRTLERAATISPEDLALLDPARKRQLVEAAKAVLKRYQ